jgi:molybdopterin-guanine dinucleotide biosynthesis protein A
MNGVIPPFDAVILAGGAATRFGGVDKPGLDLDGRPLLAHVLDAVAPAQRRVVVGPPRAVPRGVLLCRESPPGGGPVAALAAGIVHTSASSVVVLAADLPWIGPAVVRLLAGLEAGKVEAAILVDRNGRLNPLAAAWRRSTLLAALAREPPTGRAMRQLLDAVPLVLITDEDGWSLDCDTQADLDRARTWLAAGRRPGGSWLDA